MVMAHNLRARKGQYIECVIDDEKKQKNVTIQKKFARFIVQLIIFALMSIFIFYSVRFVCIALFELEQSSNDYKISLTSEDYWTQPLISLELIPNNIFSTSPTMECGELNKEWNMQSFTKREAMDIVQKELNLNDAALHKIDDPMNLFKFVIMNKFGGFYMDQRGECKGSIDEWIQFYHSTEHIQFNNYFVWMNDDEEKKKKYFVDLDMIIAFESSMPFEFANWSFFSKPNNAILQFVIDSYLEYIENKSEYVGPHVFTEAIVGFVDAFTNDRFEAMSFHKMEDGKGHIVSLYLDDDIIHILVVSMHSYWQISKRKRPQFPKQLF